MAHIQISKEYIATGSKEDLKVFSTKNGTCLFSYKHQFDKGMMDGNNKPLDQRIEDLCMSVNGEYLCAIYSDKRLEIVSAESWTISKEIKVRRRPTAMTFDPKGKWLLVADKSGDLYQYDIEVEIAVKNDEIEQKEGEVTELQPVLGHVSMLLDVEVTHDGKYILTADRDEKIRVSELENPFVIQSYCLGHTDFVCKVQPLPIEGKSLVLTTSGDGTVRLWDAETGKAISRFASSEVEDENGDLVTDDPKLRFVPALLASTSSGKFFVSASNQNGKVSLSVFKLYGEKPDFAFTSDTTIPNCERIVDLSFGPDSNVLYVLMVSESEHKLVLVTYNCDAGDCKAMDSAILDTINSFIREFTVPEDGNPWEELFKIRFEGEAYASYHKKKEERLASKNKRLKENGSAPKKVKLDS